MHRSPRSDDAEDRARTLHDAWVQVLDRLQRDVEEMERLAAEPEPPTTLPTPEPWQAPVLDGPLPDALLGQALALHRRQSAARVALTEALARVRARQQQEPRSSRAPRTAGRAAPAYVDLSA